MLLSGSFTLRYLMLFIALRNNHVNMRNDNLLNVKHFALSIKHYGSTMAGNKWSLYKTSLRAVAFIRQSTYKNNVTIIQKLNQGKVFLIFAALENVY